MRCDYIRATFRQEVAHWNGEIVDAVQVRMLELQGVLGGEWRHEKRSLNGYRERFGLWRGDDHVCWFMTGGSGDAEGTHMVEASGHNSPEVKEALDNLLPDYNTARRDTCFDFIDEPGLPMFHELAAIGRSMAAERRVSYDQVGQGWHVPGETMTAYLGSRKSPVFMRIYTRGLKTLKEGGVDNPLRVRVEIEVKPNKSAQKRSLRELNDAQLFGCAKWALEFIQQAGIQGIDRHIVGTVWKPSDRQRAFSSMVKQYGRLIEEVIKDHGDEEFLRMLRVELRQTQEVRRALEAVAVSQIVEAL